jgi:hypothetical protein
MPACCGCSHFCHPTRQPSKHCMLQVCFRMAIGIEESASRMSVSQLLHQQVKTCQVQARWHCVTHQPCDLQTRTRHMLSPFHAGCLSQVTT